ncbi:MAG TPA: hypothetical protein VJT54_15985 [Verrucomicrobiae bacterium]|nr:hypothetical protein [Verrucomicrobiae bacterium]
MRALRAEKERDLLNGMADSNAHYPLQSGIRDVIAYYYAGSLTDAMFGLVEKTGSDGQANLASTAEVRKALQSPH